MNSKMEVYLVQHAKAMPKEEDPDRPLTEEGQDEVDRVAAFLAKYGDLRVRNVYHSGKTRARQTAEVLARNFTPDGSVRAEDGLSPLDDPSEWASRLDDEEGVMLVGHMPHLSKLASRLVCGDEDAGVVDFQNGGVVCLGGDPGEGWSVRWVFTPRLAQ